MTWTIVSALCEMLSAVGVIFSLVYLAKQIKESSKSTKASLRESVVRQQIDWLNLIANNQQSCRIWLRGSMNIQNLNDDEKGQFMLIMFSFLKSNESIFLHYCDGLLDNEVWEINKKMLAAYITQPGGKFYVSKRIEAFNPRFQKILREIDEVDKLDFIYDKVIERNR
ncbi:MAG TPA: hypothetical protein VG737_11785 [Cyclobacteriaceae bacterium]|nr:hypothetical protein [Cyclobacteriaceae bacterium]